jgi:hypothetical protein
VLRKKRLNKMQKTWYSYKLRSECFYDICAFGCAIHEPEFEQDEIRLLNTIIKDVDMSFEWEFDSNLTLEELRDVFTRVNNVGVEDLHRMVQTLNYKAVYTGEAYYIEYR